MSLTVKNLIDKYSKITEATEITENETVSFKAQGRNAQLTEEEERVLAALNMGVVTEKVLRDRRFARKSI
jgi:predicted DNA binding protein